MPLPLLAAAAPSIIQAGAGIIQSIFGGNREKKAEQALENLKTPTYNPNKSILDYYNKALQRYNVNPYQSQEYQYATQNAANNTAAGINALQDRRSAIGGISRLTAAQNDAGLKAGMAAENQRTQNFNQLGQATGIKSADDRYGFQINQMLPYQKQYALLGAKAGGGANILNAGLSNIFGGLSSGSELLSDNYLNRQPKSSQINSNSSNNGMYYDNEQYYGE